ncbi:hypothetical protein GCM10008171_24470 [Methylopila jiangsuensis]|uniref:Phenylacetate-CoA ligase n=1 Tax=Methylopila jiangsuensis TaxID=586230 RepID=A0A9W6JJ50_9HYPH|nr:hypothetical protein [Methylopila jiangsuensis]MDR6286467.1 phenylacetate-coenzyme A ligase PaaK-like adenylate-forming protein [Methylopila jiangsuensis]GLK77193.1 hypothetical protein GCM10008171_24470 [Methylopila jiangsuensis]
MASAAQSDRAYDWWRLDGAKSLASFMSTYEPSMRERGSTRGGWRIGRPDSTRHVLELIADIGAQVDWLARVRPAYLFARGGAHLQALAEEAARRDAPLRFERILSTGTAMTPEARAAARRAFRCDVLDLYGASETGLIAAQCPDCGLMHSCDETMRVEVLRDDGAPAAEGELGRVVVTPLYAYAMPMIRYAIGDYAIRGPETAPCGRSLGSLRAVVGRARNLFHLADGRVLAPYANASGFRAFIDYRQIQLVQTALDRIEIRYVAASDRPVDAEGAAAFVRERFDPSLEAELVRVDHIPAGHGKFEETLSILAP